MQISPLILVIVLGVPALALLALRLVPGARIFVRLRQDRDAARRDRPADMEITSTYHDQLPADARVDAIDDRTWQDLDLEHVFVSIDRTWSEPGRQFLYHMLRSPHSALEPLQRLERAVRRVAGDAVLAARLREVLRLLDDRRAGQLCNLILRDVPRRPMLWWAFPLLTIGSIACLALIAVWPRAIVAWTAICVINVGIQIFYKPRVKRFIPALHEIPAFVRASALLGRLDVDELSSELRILRDGSKRMSSLGRAARWLMFEPGQAHELAAMTYEYVNVFFLFDVNAFVFATESLRESRACLRDMFDALGHIDSVQSIAGWRDTLPRWTTPVFTGTCKALSVAGLTHPLLTDPVPNSLDIEGASVLITGSNMSGKTTFIRAMGVNAVLSQTLYTVCADTWRAPTLNVRTSIGRSDNIMEGKSYYLAEVESVRSLVLAKEDGRQHLFLLDEIFRGTNTTERVAAAYAVLSYLNRGIDLVIVATHDIEVIGLLGDAYASHHFREEIADGTVTFDYRIHDGPSSTRNAIALLRVMDYPDALVADALAALDWPERHDS